MQHEKYKMLHLVTFSWYWNKEGTPLYFSCSFELNWNMSEEVAILVSDDDMKSAQAMVIYFLVDRTM